MVIAVPGDENENDEPDEWAKGGVGSGRLDSTCVRRASIVPSTVVPGPIGDVDEFDVGLDVIELNYPRRLRGAVEWRH